MLACRGLAHAELARALVVYAFGVEYARVFKCKYTHSSCSIFAKDHVLFRMLVYSSYSYFTAGLLIMLQPLVRFLGDIW